MATSPYFNTYRNNNEQDLVENLIIEAIKIHGVDVYYLPRTLNAVDELYESDDQSTYESAHMIEMYVKNVDGFAGDGNFLAKFGLEIRDQITFTVARRSFATEVAQEASISRPQEGDLIYFPMDRKLYQIKFVDHQPIFYQLGRLYVYDLKCELFEYSSEEFSTGIPDIDNIYLKFTTDTLNGSANSLANSDPISDNVTIETDADSVLNFTDIDPFSANGSY